MSQFPTSSVTIQYPPPESIRWCFAEVSSAFTMRPAGFSASRVERIRRNPPSKDVQRCGSVNFSRQSCANSGNGARKSPARAALRAAAAVRRFNRVAPEQAKILTYLTAGFYRRCAAQHPEQVRRASTRSGVTGACLLLQLVQLDRERASERSLNTHAIAANLVVVSLGTEKRCERGIA